MRNTRMSAAQYEARARQLLPDYATAYFGATAGSGVSDAEGTADWSAVRFRPYTLRDVSTIDTATTVLGTPVRTPVLIAPMRNSWRRTTKVRRPWRDRRPRWERCWECPLMPPCRSRLWRLRAHRGGSRST